MPVEHSPKGDDPNNQFNKLPENRLDQDSRTSDLEIDQFSHGVGKTNSNEENKGNGSKTIHSPLSGNNVFTISEKLLLSKLMKEDNEANAIKLLGNLVKRFQNDLGDNKQLSSSNQSSKGSSTDENLFDLKPVIKSTANHGRMQGKYIPILIKINDEPNNLIQPICT